jgi:hypothetical protein
MRSKSDFWLDLQRLEASVAQEGETDEERIASLIDVLDGMPHTKCGVYLENLYRVSVFLNALMAKCKQR